MPYFEVQNFAAGMDLRKSAITAPAGTLRMLQNAHVTAGGEIDKRSAFSKLPNKVPANSFSLVSMGGLLYTLVPDGSLCRGDEHGAGPDRASQRRRERCHQRLRLGPLQRAPLRLGADPRRQLSLLHEGPRHAAACVPDGERHDRLLRHGAADLQVQNPSHLRRPASLLLRRRALAMGER